MRSILVILLFSAFLVSCEQEEGTTTEQKTAPTTAFLSSTNFSNVDVTALADTDLEDHFSTGEFESSFYTDPDEEEDQGMLGEGYETSEECKAILESIGDFETVGEEGRVTLKYFLETPVCQFTVTSPFGVFSGTIKFMFKLYAVMTCAEQDFTGLNSEQINELKPENCSDYSTLVNAETETQGTYVFGGVVTTNKSKSLSMEANENGQPCQGVIENGVFEASEACEYHNLSESEETGGEDGDTSEKVYLKLVNEGIKANATDNSRFPFAGTTTVELNGWSGVVTYDDQNEYPTFTLSKGEVEYSGPINDKGFPSSLLLRNNFMNKLLNFRLQR